jgi:hypothetical protein
MNRESMSFAALAVTFATVIAACERSTTVTAAEQEVGAVARAAVNGAEEAPVAALAAREGTLIDRIVDRVPPSARREVRELLRAEHAVVYGADSPELNALLDELYSVRAARVQRQLLILRSRQLPKSR